MADSTPVNSIPAAPASPPPSGTIDITNLVASLQNTFVQWATTYLAGLAVAAFPPLGWPIIGSIFSYIVGKIVSTLAAAAEMESFFLNTAVRKASQAQDFISAVGAKNSLPPTASNEDYANAEKAEMAAFRNFVLLSN